MREDTSGAKTDPMGADRDVVPDAGTDQRGGSGAGGPGSGAEESRRAGELPDRLDDALPAPRTTHTAVARTFGRFLNALGRTDLELDLDYYGAWGGYRIVTADQHTPFGSRRHTKREMVDLMEFAIDALFVARKEE
jgi:hypothetical protein